MEGRHGIGAEPIPGRGGDVDETVGKEEDETAVEVGELHEDLPDVASMLVAQSRSVST